MLANEFRELDYWEKKDEGLRQEAGEGPGSSLKSPTPPTLLSTLKSCKKDNYIQIRKAAPIYSK